MSGGDSLNTPEIRPARADDLVAVVELLTACGLPAGDLSAAHLGDFFVAIAEKTPECPSPRQKPGSSSLDLLDSGFRRNDELTVDQLLTTHRLVGVVGLEPLGSFGLLRSLAVAPDCRNTGLAHRLVTACEERAKGLHGISDLYLLTTTAVEYFLRRGYREVARESVPGAVATHPQFLGLCPASARCLAKNLIAPHTNNQTKETEGFAMKKLEVFDPAMCCSTGVCGVDVDPVLVQFAADLQWLAEQNVEVKRYNLGQEPQAFAANPVVIKEMEAGMERLPILVVDGSIVATGVYLSRAQLAQKLGIALAREDKPRIKVGGSCCNPKSGCC
ncbi:MAG: arsenite efflux transporter metallochaperone ArsD [Propionivibrio sp.]|nr:arsenite efflux transporter metallochaperone ArsD [Propionivibrio sp.]